MKNIMNLSFENKVALVTGAAMGMGLATAKAAFEAGQTTSTPQGAGIVSYQHSALLAQYSAQQFSDPDLENNIIYQNRSFYWDDTIQDLAPAALRGAFAGAGWAESCRAENSTRARHVQSMRIRVII